MVSAESQVSSIRGELEIVQKALKLQTRRCRQLVAEYTRRLQLKEQQYQSEKKLRDDQLARVLRALLVFEARLRQEQKYISHQLEEKDYIIKKQNTDIRKLLSGHYCKNCSQYYSPSSTLESLDSSLDYAGTDYHNSNFESLDSSSEMYASIYEKDSDESQKTMSVNSERFLSDGDEPTVLEAENTSNVFKKNKYKNDSSERRQNRRGNRKSTGHYFNSQKSQTCSNNSNNENTSNDYGPFSSLQSDSITNKISAVSGRIENIFNQNDFKNTARENCEASVQETLDANDLSSKGSTSVITVIKSVKENCSKVPISKTDKQTESKISNTIPVFEDDCETNDNWYASASDQEDEEQRGIYRNNPVLECMNQILLQNISDSLSSPPKTPDSERKLSKNNKRVKFSDEDGGNVKEENVSSDYYETPIQKMPNFYETPQSIYSNDYEQIVTFQNNLKDSPLRTENLQERELKSNTSLKKFSITPNIDFEGSQNKTNHYYVDMDTRSEQDEKENKIVRKSKIMRTPPALPPKPANLISKYKIQSAPCDTNGKDKCSEKSLDSEPDYCSISEINLPTEKNISFKKINVVAEINLQNTKISPVPQTIIIPESYISNSDSKTQLIPDLVVKKIVEKPNIQLAKQTPLKQENVVTPKKSPQPDIPKLPHVTEIIIPDENEPNEEEDKHISQDNYVKNNTQVLKPKTSQNDRTKPIRMGSSVSSLIADFNNKQLLTEINKNPVKHKLNKRMFSSFENLQNLEKHSYLKTNRFTDSFDFEKFDLSQNFEEFKLDDCEIGDYPSPSRSPIQESNIINKSPTITKNPALTFNSPTQVELVRATGDLTIPQLNVQALQQLKKKLELQKNMACNEKLKQNHLPENNMNEPTYEHFLECTGLSSKSILTPSRLLSNHKSMLKPKDVKLRSKVRSNLFETQGRNTVKYWSEPYL